MVEPSSTVNERRAPLRTEPACLEEPPSPALDQGRVDGRARRGRATSRAAMRPAPAQPYPSTGRGTGVATVRRRALTNRNRATSGITSPSRR